MPSLAELMTGAIEQAGSQIPNDPAIKHLSEQKRQTRDAALKELFLGKQIEEAERLRGKYGPATGVNVEGVSLQPQDPVRGLAQRRLQEEADEKKIQGFAKRLADQNVPETQQVMGNLGSSVEKHGFAINPLAAFLGPKVASTVESYAPEAISKHIVNPGAVEQMQSFEAMKAFRRKPLFGQSLTGNEKVSFDEAMGMFSTGTEEQKLQALNTMQNLYNKSLSNVKAAYPERIKQEYTSRGGVDLEPVPMTTKVGGRAPATTPAAGGPPAGMTFEQFKAWKKTQKPGG